MKREPMAVGGRFVGPFADVYRALTRWRNATTPDARRETWADVVHALLEWKGAK